ncbi:MAG TPA: 16S rRNA (guanine(966)-N(2))-methyltransferase RsmD [Rhizomicrobium sp.]|nr:16S rRNA (guanine(966)-N(2))-methyltransferase RsmD [Rhizomicrobium sp.]
MRVTGGQFRGRLLAEPPDNRVRPTSDKVRQAIFNMLAHHDFGADFTLEGARVIDLFAGTGALGIEALSRGAAFVLFVDDSADSRALIRRNVEALGLTGVTRIWRRDAADMGPATAPFDLALLDAPYRKGLTEKALASLAAGGWLSPNAIAIAEIAADERVTPPPGFLLQDRRDYGETAVHTFKVSPG